MPAPPVIRFTLAEKPFHIATQLCAMKSIQRAASAIRSAATSGVQSAGGSAGPTRAIEKRAGRSRVRSWNVSRTEICAAPSGSAIQFPGHFSFASTISKSPFGSSAKSSSWYCPSVPVRPAAPRRMSVPIVSPIAAASPRLPERR